MHRDDMSQLIAQRHHGEQHATRSVSAYESTGERPIARIVFYNDAQRQYALDVSKRDASLIATLQRVACHAPSLAADQILQAIEIHEIRHEETS